MAYVVHDCKNCKTGKCNNRWIDKDLTHCKSRPPMWKYCRECAKELGIDFDKQSPSDGSEIEENEDS